MILRRALAAMGCLLAATPAALADGTVRLDGGRAAPTALVAMGLDGRAAALYPRLGKVRMVVAIPDATGVAQAAPPEDVPIARGAVVEGLVFDASGRALILARTKNDCSDLFLVTRDSSGVWSTAPLGGIPSRDATLAVDPAGGPALATIGCAGAVSVRRPDAAGVWAAEPVPATAGATARVALALGAAGVAVVALDGAEAHVLSRSGAGAWTTLPLPERPLFPGERIVSFHLAIEASGAPVASMTRAGPLAQGISGTAAPTVAHRLDRFAAGAWLPVATGGVPATDVAGLGDTWVARRRDGTLLVQSAAGAIVVPVDAVGAAAAPGGRMAYVPRGAPSTLGLGIPPRLSVVAPRTVRFGERARLAVTLATPAGMPVVGARVRGGGRSSITDAAGRLTLRPVMTRTSTLDIIAAEPGPSAPVRAPLRIVVRPQPVSLKVGRVVGENGSFVRGTARGGAALAGPLGRVYLVNLRAPGRGFLPGAVLLSAPGGRRFSFPVSSNPRLRLGVFFKGALIRLR